MLLRLPAQVSGLGGGGRLRREAGVGAGGWRPEAFARHILDLHMDRLDLCDEKEFVSPHRAAVTALGMESVEGRYLLTGGGDGRLALFDTGMGRTRCTSCS